MRHLGAPMATLIWFDTSLIQSFPVIHPLFYSRCKGEESPLSACLQPMMMFAGSWPIKRNMSFRSSYKFHSIILRQPPPYPHPLALLTIPKTPQRIISHTISWDPKRLHQPHCPVDHVPLHLKSGWIKFLKISQPLDDSTIVPKFFVQLILV